MGAGGRLRAPQPTGNHQRWTRRPLSTRGHLRCPTRTSACFHALPLFSGGGWAGGETGNQRFQMGGDATFVEPLRHLSQNGYGSPHLTIQTLRNFLEAAPRRGGEEGRRGQGPVRGGGGSERLPPEKAGATEGRATPMRLLGRRRRAAPTPSCLLSKRVYQNRRDLQSERFSRSDSQV